MAQWLTAYQCPAMSRVQLLWGVHVPPLPPPHDLKKTKKQKTKVTLLDKLYLVPQVRHYDIIW